MLDQLTTIPTDAGAGFLAGAAAEIHMDVLQDHPYLFNPLTDKIHDMERLLPAPLRQQTSRSLETVADFIAYVNRFKKPETSIYAKGLSICAEIDHRSTTALVWPDHKADITLAQSEPLARWRDKNKKPLTQEEFADLLEERSLDIATPTAADILELVQELHVTKSSAATSSLRGNGKHTLAFNSDQAVRGGISSVELPTSFEIRIEPFKNQDVVCEIRALLRVRLREEHPVFIFDFQKLDERIAEALEEIIATIKAETNLPVYR